MTAVQLEPASERPHFFLAVMDVYRGDLHAALRGLQIARRLQPTGLAYTNIAETFIYLGDIRMAKRWNRTGYRRGASIGAATFNEMLISWSSGDLRGARRSFATLQVSDPDMLRTINAAPLPTQPRSFEEFAGYCCRSPACGPYLDHACADLGLAVRYREV